MEKNQMQINVTKDLFVKSAYKALNGSCRLVLFEMAFYGGSGDLAAFNYARGRTDEQALAILVQQGLVEIEDGQFRLLTNLVKQDNGAERVRKSRAAKKPVVSAVPSQPAPVAAPNGIACPHEEIVEAYNSILGSELGRVAVINATRREAIKNRWNDVFKVFKKKTRQEGIEFFKWYFSCINEIEFYMRRTEKYKQGAHGNWRPDFDFFMKQKHFVKIYEDEYNKYLAAQENRSDHE